jgi:uncharacterized protein (DUF1330 family)
MPLTLCVLLWAVAGQEGRLSAYEDEVLALIPEHGGAVVSRVRRVGADADAEQPYEVHVIELPNQAAMDDYLADPRRTALASVREVVVARTEIIPVDQVSPG